MAWSFREMSRGEMNTDPVEGEFFTPEGLADALVRESIQNSLDARPLDGRQNSTPVRVRFHLVGETKGLSSKDAARYLDGLWPHLDAFEKRRENRPTRTSQMSFLVVEDFGTQGLCGPTDQEADIDADSNERKDFFYFWRNVGRSRKQDAERGRWGLGKTVFPATSRVNSFFGLTVRADDGQTLLMGQSVLKIHRIDAKRFCPYGFFANTGDDDFQQPLDDIGLLNAFRSDFNLERVAEPGLSVVIPFPDVDEIKTDHMIRSAILHYFYPILRRELIVDVSGDEGQVSISADSIDKIAESTTWDDTSFPRSQLQHLFDFVRRALAVADEELILLPDPKPSRAPDWKYGRLTDETVAAIKEQFDKQKMLAVRVPITVRPKVGKERSTFFDVFIERDATLDGPEDHYIREGITISKICALREKEFRGLVVVSDKPLSTLLGDSENPSHTEWIEKATKFKQRYDWGPFTVRFLRNALQRIVSRLLFIPEGRDEDLLKDLFYVQEESLESKDPSKGKGKTKTDGNTEEGELDPILPTPKPFEIQKIQGGFRIVREDSESQPPPRISVEVAYEVRRGNPFRKYDKLDFQLANKPIRIETVGALAGPLNNTIDIVPEGTTFLVEVSGFDQHRDLAVRARPLCEEETDAANV